MMVTLREITAKTELLTFLNQDRFYNAYALADLADPYFKQCRWLGAEEDGRLVSLLLIFYGLSVPALLPLGEAKHLSALLARFDLPSNATFLAKSEQRPPILAHYHPQVLHPMQRMVLTADRFRPLTPKEAIRLNENHLDQLWALYREVEGNAFAEYQLQQGVFYGIFAGSTLVSAAGTHIVAPTYRIAALGNVCTRPDYTGHGYAQQVTSAVCTDLLAQQLDLVLNVAVENEAAIHIYRKIGFEPYCVYWEGQGESIDQPDKVVTGKISS